MNPSATRRDATPRRGMLLLLVLSILALFLIVGAVGVLLALRARESARAFAAASAGAVGSPALARAQLDEALLRLIRGGSPAGAVTECLLEDKYGTSQSGTVTALSGATTAVMQATVTGLDLTNPTTIAGRLITFVPAAGDPTAPSSYRILRAGPGGNTLVLANVKPTDPLPLPARFPCEVVVNGREFTGEGRNEPYDAFDTQNPFLTQPVLQSSTVSSIARPAFGTAGATCTVDNDGDGVPDGVWLADLLPRQRTPDGGELSFDVSYLVLDLDGRLNVNAHGSYVRAQVPQTTAQYPSDPRSSPPGMGYGPADVDVATLLSTGAEVTAGSVPARWVLLLQGGSMTQNALVSSASQWRPTPRAETIQAGRYGLGAGVQPGGSVITGTNPLNSDAWFAGNSPTDLKARLQVSLQGSPPVLRFVRPTSGPAWGSPDIDDVFGAGTAAHPYRMRLDDDAPRAAGTFASDAPYTVGELERLLRQFDADAAQLAPRLAAMLDDLAEPSRMTVTTDSWDSPAIIGSAAQRIRTSLAAGANPYAMHSPETVAGLRFNLNRPLVSTAARQDYFRQLYTLAVALGAPVADAAQWAANVTEFRDADSIMTWYPYDTTPLDGWTTNAGVWGMERPELVITEATLTSGSTALSVNLYRPWNAQLCVGSPPTATGTTELIDASLGNRTTNTLNAAGVSGADAVWQLVATGATGATAGGPSGLNSLVSSATAVPPDTAVGPATVTLTGTATQLVLRRLANPGAARDTNQGSATYNDYVPVHQVSVPQASRTVSRWLHWPNRDLVSHGELLTVLSSTAAVIPEAMFSEAQETCLARSYPLLLDATLVPSRFVGANVSVAAAATNLAGTGFENFQYGHFSRWREPGRVNVNTILPNAGNPVGLAHLDNAVWTALVGRPGQTNPATPTNVVQTDSQLLTGAIGSGGDGSNAFLKRATAIRLANVATTRSHVFGVWITLRITDSSPNAGPPRFHRLFAVVDRSVPAGYAPGRTLNARDTIRLQRYVE